MCGRAGNGSADTAMTGARGRGGAGRGAARRAGGMPSHTHTLGAVLSASSAFLWANAWTLLLPLERNSEAKSRSTRTALNRSGCWSIDCRIKFNACDSGCHSPPPVFCQFQEGVRTPVKGGEEKNGETLPQGIAEATTHTQKEKEKPGRKKKKKKGTAKKGRPGTCLQLIVLVLSADNSMRTVPSFLFETWFLCFGDG